MQNIEIKYRLDQREAFENRLRTYTDIQFEYSRQQRDIYFGIESGRMKIRIQDELQPHLITYQRADEAIERISNYEIEYLDDWLATHEQLVAQHGLIGEVVKQRTLYFYKNVRIHLDQVEGLGSFLEFESVISAGCHHEQAQANLDELNRRVEEFLMEPQSANYLDLILAKSILSSQND